AQRKEKLLSKGLSQDEVDRGVREYCGFTDDSKPPMYEKPSNDVGKTDSTTPGVSQIKPAGAKPSNGAPGGREPGESPAEPTAGSGTEQRLFCLKDVQNVTYVIGNTPQPGQEKDRSHDGGQPSDSNRRDLTEAEKAELEKAGRLIAYRELQKLDYVVEVMPPENPGFDLLGRGGDGELRVEVKAHLGKATVAELTQRQYKEYLGQNGFRWELWNVERLANRDTEQVTLTRYTCIPDEALDARTFRVDLRKCQSE
ncbi:MAG: hypothetical protein KJ052_05790, partial [Candidatus Hydrogenedentes bacterium]|nr:hypothetical protein [Candidatus Hydrogenedentota bacterium]